MRRVRFDAGDRKGMLDVLEAAQGAGQKAQLDAHARWACGIAFRRLPVEPTRDGT